MFTKVKNWLEKAFFPDNITCIICGCELSHNTHFCLCDNCLANLPKNNGKTCHKCGEPILNTSSNYCLRCKHQLPTLTQCFSPLLYKSPVTSLIKQFKYDNKKYLAQTLGNFLVESYVVNNLNCDIILPVPLHEKRLKQRGFNQSYLLAKQMADKLNLPIYEDVLIRVKNTLTQTLLTKQERQANVSHAFKVTNKDMVKNKVVLLIDDVYTTGSTLSECATECFKAGAKSVYAITIAHTMPNNLKKGNNND